MIPNLLCCLILCQLCTYGMLNKIVNPSNNLCIVCFSCIYQSNIPFINIPRYHISSTNISSHLLTLKKISHYTTLIRIVLSIQPHAPKLKKIISFSSHNQQIRENQNAKEAKKKIPDCRNWINITEIEKISFRSYAITPKKIAEIERKYQIYRNRTQILDYRK
jgi:hypothetical protein